MLKHLLIGAIALSGLALTAAEVNLIKNPGFEEKGSWQLWGTGPGLTSEDMASIMTYDNTVAASGAWSLKITDTWEKHSPYVIQFVPLEKPAAGYLLTFKAKAEDGAEFRAGALFNKGTPAKHEFLGGAQSTLRGTGEWKEYTVAITNLKEGTDMLAIVLAPCKYGEGNTGTVWFDDVSLVAAE